MFKQFQFVGAVSVFLVACSSGGQFGGGIGGGGTGNDGTGTGGTTGGDSVPAPFERSQAPRDDSRYQPTIDEDALFREALKEALADIENYERDVAAGCVEETLHSTVLTSGLEAFELELVFNSAIAGLDWPGVLSSATLFSPSEGIVKVLNCAQILGGDAGLQDPINAFALQHLVVFKTPLLNAFAETAAYWGYLDSLPPEQVEEYAWYAAAAQIFTAHHQGNPWSVISLEEVDAWLSTSSFAAKYYVQGAHFVLFHELGHTNLAHAAVESAIRRGIDTLLSRRGRTPSPAQLETLRLTLAKLSRQIEAQADIYAATVMQRLGYDMTGPSLFVYGMLGRTHLLGCSGLEGDALQFCLYAPDPMATHPPLPERYELLQRILVDGEDLSHLLEMTNLDQIR